MIIHIGTIRADPQPAIYLVVSGLLCPELSEDCPNCIQLDCCAYNAVRRMLQILAKAGVNHFSYQRVRNCPYGPEGFQV